MEQHDFIKQIEELRKRQHEIEQKYGRNLEWLDIEIVIKSLQETIDV